MDKTSNTTLCLFSVQTLDHSWINANFGPGCNLLTRDTNKRKQATHTNLAH